MSRLRPDIRAGEGKGLVAAFLTLFLVLAAHTLLETARDALFLAHIPAAQLPWLYIAIAAAALGVTRSRRAIQGRLRSRRALGLLLLSSAGIAVGFWAIAGGRHPATFYALYIWSGIFATLVTLQFWLVLGDIYTVTQAKRLYGFIAGGSIAGAVGGSGLAYALTLAMRPGSLLLAAAGLLALAAFGPMFLAREMASKSTEAPLARGSIIDDLRMVQGNRYLHRVAALVLVSALAVTLVDWIWKSQVAAAVAPQDLGRFFAATSVAFNVLALVVQLVLAGLLFRGLGAAGTLALFPLLLAFGAAGVLFVGTLWAVLLLKGTDGALRYGVHRTGVELLYVPLGDRIRSRAKSFIDVTMQRGGQALGSLALLAVLFLGADVHHVTIGLAVLVVVWVVLALDVKRYYLDLFRDALGEGSFATRVELPQFDVSSLETVIAALSSDQDELVLAALDLLEAQGKVRLIPALLVYHPSPVVVERTLELFVGHGRTDFMTLTGRLMRHESPEVRAAALRARMAVTSDPTLLHQAMFDSSPVVVATAVVGLVVAGEAEVDKLDEVAASHDPAARRALATAIARNPSPRFVEVLSRLVHDISQSVRVEAVRATTLQPSPEFVPALVDLLAGRIRAEVRTALLAHGDHAFEFLALALVDETLPHAVRRHIPRTLSLFAPARAAPILLERFEHERDGMVRFKILRGLGRLKAKHPELELDSTMLDRAITSTLETLRRLVHWRRVVEGKVEIWDGDRPRETTPVQELLAALLIDKRNHTVERLFRLLGLAQPDENFEHIHRGLIGDDVRVRAQSVELLSNVLVGARRDEVIEILDGLSGEELPAVRSYAGTLESLLDSSSESLAGLAAYHAAELGLEILRPRIEQLRRRTSRFLPEIASRALEIMTQATSRRSAHG
jgi:ATP:ADP antiporter, AAA family